MPNGGHRLGDPRRQPHLTPHRHAEGGYATIRATVANSAYPILSNVDTREIAGCQRQYGHLSCGVRSSVTDLSRLSAFDSTC